jgi:hypothetical protein
VVLQLRCSPQADGLMLLRAKVCGQSASLRRNSGRRCASTGSRYIALPATSLMTIGPREAKRFKGPTGRADASRTSADLVGGIFRR